MKSCMIYKSYDDLSLCVKNNLSELYNYDFDLVVGLPRSGIIPAYMIALQLNLRCTDLPSLIANTQLKNGNTRGVKEGYRFPHESKKILLVDDSINSGGSLKSDLQLIPCELKNKITTLAIYSSESIRSDVDIIFEYVPMPRVFEWNIFHHSILGKSSVDIDGVLCVDPTEEENDDGEKYINFLLNAKPLFLPTVKIHSLVTSRLEKYRQETEAWLSKHHIQYDQLVMLNLPNKEARQKENAYASHKAECYKTLKTHLFIESDTKQAIEISRLSAKPVYCVEGNKLYTSSLVSEVYRNPHSIKKYIPVPIKELLNFFLKYFKSVNQFWQKK